MVHCLNRTDDAKSLVQRLCEIIVSKVELWYNTLLYSVHSTYMSDKWRSEPKDSEMLQILKTKQKEIAMEKRKSYAELEPVKKKLCLERFCHYYTNVKKKERLQRLLILYHMFSKKKVKEGLDYICSAWCLVNYHINCEKLFFPCVSQSTQFLLLLVQTWRKARLEQCKENS